jgi:iron(III) transport system ATP-binding protein
MISVGVKDLVVRFGANTILDRVTLDARPGELFLLLGPSGCGKTTLLRTIAGFAQASAGQVLFGDEDVTASPPHRRSTGMVFQSFALFSHLGVAENVAFGLRERKVGKAEIERRVRGALEAVHMEGHLGRRVDQLSGGEQQRVALARALVIEPRCLLLDEPLSNLDAKLRHSMREEIRRVCKEHGLTTLYVTHDQKEALAIADRIAVMDGGRILQIATPEDIYRRPASRAVAEFIGETNLLRGTAGSGATVETPLGTLGTSATDFAQGAAVHVSIRPECFAFAGAGIAGRVLRTTILGEIAEHEVETAAGILKVYELNGRERQGEVHLSVAPDDVVLLPIESRDA